MAGMIHASTLGMGILNGVMVGHNKNLKKSTLYTYMSVAVPFYMMRGFDNLRNHELKYDKKFNLPFGVPSLVNLTASVIVVGAQVCLGTQLGKAFSQVLE